MSTWDDYQREEREEQAKITGKMRCVITDVDEGVSKASGLPMITISVRPSGCGYKVKSYIVKNDHFNRNMTQFFDAFPEVGDGNFDFLTWVGCEGAAMFDLDERNYLKVKYWIDAVRAANLPPYEGDRPEKQEITTLNDEGDLDDEMPF